MKLGYLLWELSQAHLGRALELAQVQSQIWPMPWCRWWLQRASQELQPQEVLAEVAFPRPAACHSLQLAMEGARPIRQLHTVPVVVRADNHHAVC